MLSSYAVDTTECNRVRIDIKRQRTIKELILIRSFLAFISYSPLPATTFPRYQLGGKGHEGWGEVRGENLSYQGLNL